MAFSRHIDTGAATGKVKALVKMGGTPVLRPFSFDHIPNHLLLIVIDSFGKYEKSGVCYTREEWHREIYSHSYQTADPNLVERSYIYMPRAIAIDACGLYKHNSKTDIAWAHEEVKEPVFMLTKRRLKTNYGRGTKPA